jgi:tetratricopeptide (TPR) repeat protein
MDDPSTKPIYWLDGIAGTGKTTIAQSVAAIAAERLAASFFFSRTAESSGRRQTAPVIPTLAYQLAQKHKVVCSHVCSALELKPDIRTSRMEDQAHTLLSEPLAAVADGLFPLPLLVVLDGLDECDKDAGSGREGGQLISILLETFRGLPFCVKMFITSRPEPTVRNMFGEISEYTYRLALHRDIDEGVVHKDIKAYLRAELSKLAKKRSIPLPFPSDANFKTLADRAGTLFIYVRTVVEYISSDLGGSPQEQLTELLQLNVSAGSRTFASLDAVYTQTLQKALSAFGHSVAERQQFKDVLACLVLLRHSATVSDLAILTGTGQAGCAKVLRCLSSLLVYSHQAEEAIRVIHPSLADFLTDPGRCSYAEFMIGTTSRTKFASTLWECWKETENATYLEDAIRLDHGAVVLCPRGDPNRDAACSDVAFSLLRRYDHTRDATLLDEIITLDREALALHPEGHPDHAWSCANLATSLQRCYDRTGDITLLDEIITLEREALALHPEGHPDHAWSCENLANSLQRWYGHTGDITLLDEVIKLGREALALRPEGLSDHAWSFASLAVSLQICYDHTGDTALLDEVIKLAREALELRPAGHPDHAKACGNLAASLTRHFDYTGDISVLDEVIQLGREALALCPKGHPHYAIWRGNLAVCLRRRFDKTRDVALLDEITELEREAAAERSE